MPEGGRERERQIETEIAWGVDMCPWNACAQTMTQYESIWHNDIAHTCVVRPWTNQAALSSLASPKLPFLMSRAPSSCHASCCNKTALVSNPEISWNIRKCLVDMGEVKVFCSSATSLHSLPLQALAPCTMCTSSKCICWCSMNWYENAENYHHSEWFASW